MSKRQRAKGVAAAQKLVPDAHITGYVIGRSGPNPVVVVGAMIATAAAFSIALILATGAFVMPGVLPALVVMHFLSPPRAVVVASEGVALTKRSIWTGRPHDLVTVMGHSYVQPVEQSLGRVKVGVGNDTVWLSTSEETLLRTAMAQHVAVNPSPPAAPGPPPSPGQGFPPQTFGS